MFLASRSISAQRISPTSARRCPVKIRSFRIDDQTGLHCSDRKPDLRKLIVGQKPARGSRSCRMA